MGETRDLEYELGSLTIVQKGNQNDCDVDAVDGSAS